jgi:L-alanine-DL-glutamate epimerase-like enolase superfamily enzyme
VGIISAEASASRALALLLAGVGQDGLLDVDSNDSLLRDLFCPPVIKISEGRVTRNDDPGLGIEPELSSIESDSLIQEALHGCSRL